MNRTYTVNGYPVREIKAYNARTGYFTLGDSFIYDTPEARVIINFVLQPTGFGKKPLLVCPRCHSRRAKLYAAGSLVFCRGCFPQINPYANIQYSTKNGSDRIAYSMRRLAEKYGVEYFTISNFNPTGWIEKDIRPHYMRKAAFADLIGRLAILDNMRCRCIGGSLFGDSRTVKSGQVTLVCKTHPAELMTLCEYSYFIELAEEIYKVPIKKRLLQTPRRTPPLY